MAKRKATQPVLCDEKDANRYVSRLMPWVLLAIVAYASYAVTKPLCIDYLIHPQSHYNREPRLGAGVAIIVVYYVLLFPAITAYLRLYFIVAYNPDYLPRGLDWVPPESDPETRASRRHKKRKKSSLGGNEENGDREKGQRTATESADIERQTGGVAFPLGDAGQERFWMKDIYICQDDGRPAYCSRCCQFKTDRSHHNSDADRCVRKLDHFCPWVGGVVSESSYKFFLQFVVYTAIYTCFVLIVLAYFIAERRSETGSVNAQWAVALGLAALFFLFSGGMSGTSLQLASINCTTIENLSKHSKVWTLAIYISPQEYERLTSQSRVGQWALTFPTVTFPPEQSTVPSSSPAKPTSSDSDPDPDPQSTTSNSMSSTADINTYNNQSTSNTRMFAILRTQPGENPFDLGDPIDNLKQIMGHNLWDWLLPLKVSPCVDHSSTASAYAMGPIVNRLKKEAGIYAEREGAEEGEITDSRRRKRRRRRRSTLTHQRSADEQRPPS